MCSTIPKPPFVYPLLPLVIMFYSANLYAQIRPKENQLEQQIIAAQQAAQAVQNQLSPTKNIQHNGHGSKMKGMRNMSTMSPPTPKLTNSNTQIPASKTMEKMKNMAIKKIGGMGKQKMMGKKMANSSNKVQLANLPAFPGSKHIYHIGADGFFLDKGGLISLTQAQQQQLLQQQNSWQSTNQSFEEKITQAEQSLWLLTAEDIPDVTQIKAKIDQVSQLQAKQRLHFIQSVGKAATILSNKQRQTLSQQYLLSSQKNN